MHSENPTTNRSGFQSLSAWLWGWAALLLVISPNSALGQSEQLYFAGMEARLGSLSTDPGGTGVYLRWDPVEGSVPSDVASFKILRNNVQIGDLLSAQTVLTPVEIAQRYAAPSQSRRAAEILSALRDEAEGRAVQAAEDGIPVPSCEIHPVNAANLAAAIHNKIDPGSGCYDSYWALMASRLDFNVALARHRGYVDDALLASGLYSYELIGISTSNQEARLGKIEVMIDGIPDRLGAAAGFEQRDQSRCDAPEYQKDHGAVALFWKFPGTNLTERLRDSLLTSGYDLYRSTTDPGALPVLDIRAMALGQAHDADGNLVLSGLERVNTRPIMISGAPDPGADGVERDTRNVGWNAPFAHFVEAPESLAAAGVEAGDTRNYYLVARDFSGNYGETAGLRVQIPDRLAPPAPWDIETVLDSADTTILTLGGSFELVWDHADVRNYYADHLHAHDYCNLETARFDKHLTYASGTDTCADEGLREVDLDIAKYVIYRFGSPEEAQGFIDSDGDGRSDLVERVALPGPPAGLTDPGTACDDSAWPLGATDFRAPAEPGIFEIDLLAGPGPSATWSLATTADGRKQIRWRDTDPAGPSGNGRMGEVFWYAVSAIDQDGNRSTLSAPVRGFFPDRTRPQRDKILCGRPGECETFADRYPTHQDEFHFAEDRTPSARSDFVRVGCKMPGTNAVVYEKELSITELSNGVRGANLNGFACDLLVESCSGNAESYVEFHSNDGTLLDSDANPYTAQYPEGFNQCLLPNAYLDEDCDEGALVPILPGEALTEAPICMPAPNAPSECLSIERRLGDESFKWKTHCEPTPITLNVPSVGGESICLSVAIQNQNSVSSTPLRLPCFNLPTQTPLYPPQPLGITFAETPPNAKATLSWLPPEQHVVGTLLQWRRADGSESGTHFFPHPDRTATDGPLSFAEVELGASLVPGDADQEWCFMARSIGNPAANQESSWSAEMCGLRLPPNEVYPQYLPWPRVPTPGELKSLEASYLPKEGLPAVLLGENTLINAGSAVGLLSNCRGTESNGSDSACIATPEIVSDEAGFCSKIQASVGARLGFVAYRQSRQHAADPNPSEFHQVSPLIDQVHCWEELTEQYLTGSAARGHLDDPFVELVRFSATSSFHAGENGLVFVDRSPHEVGLQFRYQLVYFANDHEIVGYRTTDWLISKESN